MKNRAIYFNTRSKIFIFNLFQYFLLTAFLIFYLWDKTHYNTYASFMALVYFDT